MVLLAICVRLIYFNFDIKVRKIFLTRYSGYGNRKNVFCQVFLANLILDLDQMRQN